MLYRQLKDSDTAEQLFPSLRSSTEWYAPISILFHSDDDYMITMQGMAIAIYGGELSSVHAYSGLMSAIAVPGKTFLVASGRSVAIYTVTNRTEKLDYFDAPVTSMWYDQSAGNMYASVDSTQYYRFNVDLSVAPTTITFTTPMTIESYVTGFGHNNVSYLLSASQLVQIKTTVPEEYEAVVSFSPKLTLSRQYLPVFDPEKNTIFIGSEYTGSSDRRSGWYDLDASPVEYTTYTIGSSVVAPAGDGQFLAYSLAAQDDFIANWSYLNLDPAVMARTLWSNQAAEEPSEGGSSWSWTTANIAMVTSIIVLAVGLIVGVTCAYFARHD